MKLKRLQVKSWKEITALPPDTIYVGRDRNGRGTARHPFGNPYKVKDYGLQEALRLYVEYLRQNPELMRRIKSELRGRNLACWCSLDEQCHVDILLKIANERFEPLC